MATATFTTVEARVDQPLTNAIYKDEIQDNINQLAGAHRNLLTNGGFEIWQRGAGPIVSGAPAGGVKALTADMWGATGGSTNSLTVTQETSVVDSASVSALKVVRSGTQPELLDQVIEGYAQLRGREITFSCRVQQSVASNVQIFIADSAGTTNGATSATTGSYVLLSVTRTINAAASSLRVGFTFTTNGTYYFDNAVLVIGPAPAPYRPLHPQEELSRCQRYYETMGAVASTIFLRGYQAAGTLAGTTLFFRTSKSGTPTVTKNGTWGVTNCGQPAVGAPSTDTCNITSTVTALGDFSFTTNSTDDTVTVETNPP